MDQKKTGYFLKQLRNEKEADAGAACGKISDHKPHGVTLGDGKQYARYQHAVGTCRFL